MFKFLIPKEEKYFEYFNHLISNLRVMAEKNLLLFSSETYDLELAKQINSLEMRCDDISEKIIKNLNKVFITPFDREDILSLTKAIESVSDSFRSLTATLEILEPKSSFNSAYKMSELINLQVKELEFSILNLKNRNEIESHCKMVKDLETEVDVLFHHSLKKVYNLSDTKEIIKRKDILEMLEKISDRCQRVANIILAIFIKNS